TFRLPRIYPFSELDEGNSVAVGDFSGDGHLDLAVAGSSGVYLMRGDGHGNLQLGPICAPGSSLVATGDFNGDGILDLAAVNKRTTSPVSILLGNGQATFRTAQSFAAGSYLGQVAIADFSGDGAADLAVAGGTFSTLLGNGDGTFQTAHRYDTGHFSFI